jgi:hypothetical protein
MTILGIYYVRMVTCIATVAREVNFGMAVAFMISVEQRAIETVVSAEISHSDICLNTPDLLRFAASR